VFKAAEPALIADLFSGEPYAAAVGLRATTFQVGQLVGFAVGGVAVAGLGARTALAVDSASFAVSACLLMIGLRARAIGSRRERRDLLGGLRVVTASPRLRLLVALAALAGIWVVPAAATRVFVARAPACSAWLLEPRPFRQSCSEADPSYQRENSDRYEIVTREVPRGFAAAGCEDVVFEAS
jgi:hypothetical protein